MKPRALNSHAPGCVVGEQELWPAWSAWRLFSNDGQVGSNAVNLEYKASKVFRPKAADFAEAPPLIAVCAE
jgi:hypothetical protein